MKLQYKNIFSVPLIFVMIVMICFAGFGTNQLLKKNYAENFNKENEFSGEKGYGKLKCTKDGLYNYRIRKTDHSVLLICYNGAMINQTKEVVVPQKIDGHLVTVIDELAFSFNEYIEKLILPNSIVEIRREMVSNCPNIKSIICDGEIDVIDEFALDGFSGVVYTKKKGALWNYAKKQGLEVKEKE